MNFIRGAFTVAALAALLGACRSPATIVPGSDLHTGVLVTGNGEAKGEPDIARINLGVMVRAASAQEATQKSSEAMRQVIAALEAKGVAKKDVRTQNLSIHEERHYEPMPDPEGRPGGGSKPGAIEYVAQNMLEVTVRDLDRVSDILGAVSQAGVNQMHGVQLEVEDPKPLQAQAREKAVADARAQAEQLAALAGARLGKVLSMRSGDTAMIPPPMPMMMERAQAADSSVPFERGQLTVRQLVEMRFELVAK